MKVLDLQCLNAHVFEGWFASEADFQDQHARGLLSCPLCGDAQVSKRLSAPRLNLGASRAAPPENVPHGSPRTGQATLAPALQRPSETGMVPAHLANLPSAEKTPALAQLQAAYLRFAQHVVQHTEDVGERFSEEARKIHYGEAPERALRGRATLEQAQALHEEGISVLPLPLPDGLDGPLH